VGQGGFKGLNYFLNILSKINNINKAKNQYSKFINRWTMPGLANSKTNKINQVLRAALKKFLIIVVKLFANYLINQLLKYYCVNLV